MDDIALKELTIRVPTGPKVFVLVILVFVLLILVFVLLILVFVLLILVFVLVVLVFVLVILVFLLVICIRTRNSRTRTRIRIRNSSKVLMESSCLESNYSENLTERAELRSARIGGFELCIYFIIHVFFISIKPMNAQNCSKIKHLCYKHIYSEPHFS